MTEAARARKLRKYFRYLDALRETGITNMYGASPYLSDAFDINAKEASAALRMWMDTLSHAPIPDRVCAAIARATGAKP